MLPKCYSPIIFSSETVMKVHRYVNLKKKCITLLKVYTQGREPFLKWCVRVLYFSRVQTTKLEINEGRVAVTDID